MYETSWAQGDKKQWCDKDGKPYTDYCAAKCSCDKPVECPPPLSKCRLASCKRASISLREGPSRQADCDTRACDASM